MGKLKSFVVVLSLAWAPAFAMSDGDAYHKVGDELIECGAYYLAASVQLERAGKMEDQQLLTNLARRALDLAQVYYPLVTLKAKLAAAQEANGKILQEKGVKSLFDAYGEKCKQVMEHPGERMNYWRDRNG